MLSDDRMAEERRQAIERIAALIERYGIDAIKAALRELVRRAKKEGKT